MSVINWLCALSYLSFIMSFHFIRLSLKQVKLLCLSWFSMLFFWCVLPVYLFPSSLSPETFIWFISCLSHISFGHPDHTLHSADWSVQLYIHNWLSAILQFLSLSIHNIINIAYIGPHSSSLQSDILSAYFLSNTGVEKKGCGSGRHAFQTIWLDLKTSSTRNTDLYSELMSLSMGNVMWWGVVVICLFQLC